MATQLSAVVLTAVGDETTNTAWYYVRSVGRRLGGGFTTPPREEDAWEAYREVPVFVEINNRREEMHQVSGLSDAPRSSPKAAAEDMWREVAAHLVRPNTRLARGQMPDGREP